MTEQEQRIAIAEACGWNKTGMERDSIYWTKIPLDIYFSLSPCEQIKKRTIQLPDYLHDLNACHEMEKHLDEGHEIIGYLQHLGVTKGTNGIIWEAVHATPEQKAAAFLKAKGLWKD